MAKKGKEEKNSVENGHRHEFVKKGERWPDWGNFIIGVKGGYEAFENEEDSVKFLEEYREQHKNDAHETISVENDDGEMKRTGRIGFAA